MGALNLQTKIVLYTVGVIALMIVVFTGSNLFMDYRAIKLHLRTHVADLANGIAPTVRSDLQYKRTYELRRTVRSFSYNENILEIEILGANNEILTNTLAGGAEDRIFPPTESEQQNGAFVWSSGSKVSALAPVMGELGEILGYVFVLATAEEEHAVLRSKVANSLVFGGILGIFGCIAGFYAGKRLTRPLEKLIRASEDLASGRDPEHIQIESRDELGLLSSSFNKMVQKRKEAEVSLERSRQHLLFILRETPVGYIEWKLDFTVAYWNKAAEQIFGFKESEARGKHAMDLIVPAELHDEIETVWDQILHDRGGNENLNQNVRADGSRIMCQWNNTVIRDPDGRTIAVASLVNDVTENMKAQEQMRLAMEAAQKATRAKSEFLANMSHEIRTPMNGVIGLTELLLESDLDPQQRSYLEVIRSSGEMLITIINDILDLSKIESGKLDLTERVFNVEECLKTAFQLFSHSLQKKGLEAHIEVSNSIPRTVSGDPVRLRQIVYNLVSNAVKFTDAGSISMQAWSESITSRRVRLFVSISDTGPGIDTDRLETIFDPFSQADTSSTRSFGGTGLGLTICKRLCRMMRGDIKIDHTSPEGTRFVFSVELQTAPEGGLGGSLTGQQDARENPSEASAVRILVVEDNAVNRLVAKRILKRLGYDSATVNNGQEALDFVRAHPCDLIFMDLQMPVMDGFTATKIIREEHGSIPSIIALTASAVDGDRERCMAAGMDDYISKPINIEAVSGILSRFVKRLENQA
jgi:PAS domain S-box-containing protein